MKNQEISGNRNWKYEIGIENMKNQEISQFFNSGGKFRSLLWLCNIIVFIASNIFLTHQEKSGKWAAKYQEKSGKSPVKYQEKSGNGMFKNRWKPCVNVYIK